MLNYSTNPIASVGGGINPTFIRPEDSIYVRDVLSGFVGKGYTDLSNDDAKSAFSYLRNRVGAPTAMKLLSHALAFNQRPDMLKASPEQKVQSFYSMGSSDPEVHNILQRAGQVAQGPVSGFRDSPDVLNMQGSGRKQFTKDEMMKKAPGPLTAAAALLSQK